MVIIQALDEGGLSDTLALERLTRRWEGEGEGIENPETIWVLECLQGTLPETNMAPENFTLEKEIPIGNHDF